MRLSFERIVAGNLRQVRDWINLMDAKEDLSRDQQKGTILAEYKPN